MSATQNSSCMASNASTGNLVSTRISHLRIPGLGFQEGQDSGVHYDCNIYMGHEWASDIHRP